MSKPMTYSTTFRNDTNEVFTVPKGGHPTVVEPGGTITYSGPRKENRAEVLAKFGLVVVTESVK